MSNFSMNDNCYRKNICDILSAKIGKSVVIEQVGDLAPWWKIIVDGELRVDCRSTYEGVTEENAADEIFSHIS